MKIGILVSMINNFGEKGFYNSQEIGMAKELVKQGNKVTVYKLLKKGTGIHNSEDIGAFRIEYHEVSSIGINGIVDTKILDTKLDGLLFFSDTQLSVPSVYRWCKKNDVHFIPYIGVVESHNPNKIKAAIMKVLFKRNIAVFKKSCCLVKNQDVCNKLSKFGVSDIKLAPVGIDIDLLNAEYAKSDVIDLKNKYGFHKDEKILLFIGRLEEEKRPVDLIRIFNDVLQLDDKYRLLIVGKGRMYSAMMDEIRIRKLESHIKYIEKIKNDQIWELYRISNAFINLNVQEIFGMVILEAMYYETKVIAWHAPGPDYIIENGVSGYLVESENGVIKALFDENDDIHKNAHMRIVKEMTWRRTATTISECIKWGQKHG